MTVILSCHILFSKKIITYEVRMKNINNKINIQYSLLQALYWAAICATNGFATVYLLDKGFTSSQVGVSVAISNILGVILQPVFASIADKTNKISLHLMTAILLGIGAICFLAINFVPNIFVVIVGLFVITTAIYQTSLPLINSISVYYTNKGFFVNFGFSRSMGSVSYAIASTILGVINERYGCALIFLIGFTLFVLTIFTILAMPVLKEPNQINFLEEAETDTNKFDASFIRFFTKYKLFTVCLIGIMLVFVFHNMINSYMINVVTNLGGNSSHMGIAISIAAFSELPAMVLFTYIRKYFKSSTFIIFASFVFACKAFLTAIAGSIFMLYLVQSLQALSFAVYTPASIYFVNEIMDENDKFKGQAIITASVTLSGVFGCLLGGFIIDSYGVKNMLYLGTILSVIGAIILLIVAPRANQSQQKK